MLHAVIVDDESRSRRSLERLIEEYCPRVTVVATAEDVLSGVKAINQHQPDIVFLDIEMPNYSGFKLIEFFDEINFEIIFTTAYERHAIRAFKVSAIAYLLKPINIDELIEAVGRVEKMRQITNRSDRFPALQQNIQSEKASRLVLPAQSGLLYIQADDIIFLESEGRYTKIYIKDGSTEITTYSMKECQQLLENALFQRIHRSYIINLAYIKKYSKGRDCYVLMESGQRIDVGKNFKDELTQVVALFEK